MEEDHRERYAIFYCNRDRYIVAGKVGSGGFGTVWAARNYKTGEYIALKILTPRHRKGWRKTQRLVGQGEGTILPKLNHAHIIRHFFSYGWGPRDGCIVIGLELMTGSVDKLARSLPSPLPLSFVRAVLHQMLQALDYLAVRRLVHRDVKPDNILYTTTCEADYPGVLPVTCYRFVLGDFGLCDVEAPTTTFSTSTSLASSSSNAAGSSSNINNNNKDDDNDGLSICGTFGYRPPEVYEGFWWQRDPPHPAKATHKSDVWALFVTALWLLDADGFRRVMERLGNGIGERRLIGMVQRLAEEEEQVREFRRMAEGDWQQRATAREVLEGCFEGVGVAERVVEVEVEERKEEVKEEEAEEEEESREEGDEIL